jgi:hypothetical protein
LLGLQSWLISKMSVLSIALKQNYQLGPFPFPQEVSPYLNFHKFTVQIDQIVVKGTEKPAKHYRSDWL